MSVATKVCIRCERSYVGDYRSRFCSRTCARTGDAPARRFMALVDVTDSCWLWRGAIGDNGYGWFWPRSHEQWRAHRYSYELHVGPIPDGLVIDHLCRVRNCVRPDHLEPVAPLVNTHRGVGPSAENARKTHCIHGHADWFYSGTRRQRRCRTCRREQDRRRQRRAA